MPPTSELVDVERQELQAWNNSPVIRDLVVSETVTGWVCEVHGDYLWNHPTP